MIVPGANAKMIGVAVSISPVHNTNFGEYFAIQLSFWAMAFWSRVAISLFISLLSHFHATYSFIVG